MASLGFFKSLLTALSQPSGIAAIASIGVHGVLFVASPTLESIGLAALSDPSPRDSERTVPLLELTPEEQARLPNLDPERRAGSDSPFFFDPDTGSNGNRFPPPVPRDSFPPGGGFPPSGGFPPPGSPQPGRTPQQQTPGGTTMIPGGGGQQPGARTTPGSPQPSAGSGTGPTGTPGSLSDGSSISAEDLQSPDGLNFDGNRRDLSLNPARPGNGQPGSAPPSEGAGESPSPSPESPASGESPAQAQRLAERLHYRSEGTSDEAAESQRQAWLQDSRERTGVSNLQAEAVIETTVAYPGRTCLQEVPRTALVGVLAESGEAKTTPVLLRRTGYGFLDEHVIEQVKTSDRFRSLFAEANELVALQIAVTVDYDPNDCTDPRQSLDQGSTSSSSSASARSGEAANSDTEEEQSENAATVEVEAGPVETDDPTQD
jgi:hypothetical protein